MLKYLGSKRTLVPVLGEIATRVGASTALDLFTGTSRVAHALKRRGRHVTAHDLATYSETLAQCYVATDAADVDDAELAEHLARLNALPGRRGYSPRPSASARATSSRTTAPGSTRSGSARESHAGTPLVRRCC